MEMTNVDLRIEFKRSQRLLDVKLTSLTGKVLITLKQNKSNNTFNVEFNLDPQSDLAVEIKRDQVKKF